MLFSKKNKTEKKLIQLGYQWIVNAYRKQLKEKKLSKEQWEKALDNYYKTVEYETANKENVNVATRQTFNDNEVLPPLNVSKITLPKYDTDFVKSKIYQEYKQTQYVNIADIKFLFEIFGKEYPNAQNKKAIDHYSTSTAIDIVTDTYTEDNKNEVYSAFTHLISAMR